MSTDPRKYPAPGRRFADADVDELLDLARHGDRNAFSRLLKHYESFIYGSSMKVCGDRRQADETAQDTLVNIFRSIGRFEGESKLTTWIYSIVVNSCMMRRRQRKLDRDSIPLDQGAGSEAIPLQLPAGDASAADAPLLNAELKEAIDSAIHELPEQHRVVFFLRDVDGIATDEIAAALGITPAAVKSRLHRARMSLRNRLRRYIEAQNSQGDVRK